MDRCRFLAFAGLCLALSPALWPAPARADGAATIEVGKAWARATPPGAPTGALYLTVINKGAAADTLKSISTPAAKTAELHETKAGADGVARMRPTGPQTLAPGQMLTLAPGGKHVMLMGLAGPLKAGTSFPVTLDFEKAGPVSATVSVEALGAKPPAAAMSGMEMK